VESMILACVQRSPLPRIFILAASAGFQLRLGCSVEGAGLLPLSRPVFPSLMGRMPGAKPGSKNPQIV
jgi:hypothetical protein